MHIFFSDGAILVIVLQANLSGAVLVGAILDRFVSN